MAMLALFFAVVALLLAVSALWLPSSFFLFVTKSALVWRWREAAISRDIYRGHLVNGAGGALAGLALGMSSIRYVETLFYQ